MSTPVMILAGGRATRMGGGDKPLLMLAGRPILAHVLDRLAPQVDGLALNANGDPDRFAGFGLPVRPDSRPGHPGPLAGILAALDWAQERGAASVVTVAGDTPFLPMDLVSGLLGARGPLGLAVAASMDAAHGLRDHPTCGLWPVALRDELAATLDRDERRVRAFARRHQPGTARWDNVPIDPFTNINTPADLALAEAHLAGR
ncbi:molybdenum cofactor guanylyltransferase MobA [Paracoccus beibuensis]|uniref:molybdenum cofactor guanylyltransferase MobA n=1 Tax=Paracoccus beibuensis TaxID=547602 RepID=UPI00223F2F2B|nr:molybdenum cofactor guanylyltransferase MobA [Paracoccus beibuensis]